MTNYGRVLTELGEVQYQLFPGHIVSIAPMTAHGRQNGVSDFFIGLPVLPERADAFCIHFDEILESLAVPGEKHDKSEYEDDQRRTSGDIYIIGWIRENKPQQAVGIARIQDRIHGHQANGDQQYVDDIHKWFGQWIYSILFLDGMLGLPPSFA